MLAVPCDQTETVFNRGCGDEGIGKSDSELFAGNTATNFSIQLLAPFRELGVDRAVAERAGRIAREFGVRLPDALVAATAIEHGLGLVTRNRKHFDSIRGLRLRSL